VCIDRTLTAERKGAARRAKLDTWPH
jgi:hypothetical protein